MVIQWDEPEAENGPIEVNIKRSRGHFLSYKSCQSISKVILKKVYTFCGAVGRMAAYQSPPQLSQRKRIASVAKRLIYVLKQERVVE